MEGRTSGATGAGHRLLKAAVLFVLLFTGAVPASPQAARVRPLAPAGPVYSASALLGASLSAQLPAPALSGPSLAAPAPSGWSLPAPVPAARLPVPSPVAARRTPSASPLSLPASAAPTGRPFADLASLRDAGLGAKDGLAALSALNRAFDGASAGPELSGPVATSAAELLGPYLRPAALVAVARSNRRGLRPEPEGPQRGPSSGVLQVVERAKRLLLRAASLPGYVWPFNRLATLLSHGEPLTGPTPASAVKAAVKNGKAGLGTVVGRLAPGLTDLWSVRGAETSFLRLIAQTGEARKKNPDLKVSLAMDAASFGAELSGVSARVRLKMAESAMMRIARAAKAAGVGVEIDVAEAGEEVINRYVAERIVRELRIPVRLAIAARHESSDEILERWIALAEHTGIPLGVRLVKGSYIEAKPGIINLRAPLLWHYKALIDRALRAGGSLDVAVATQNLEIFRFAEERAAAYGARYHINVIHGVAPAEQAVMRAAGKVSAEYVSYGLDAPSFGLMELYANWRARRELVRQGVPKELLD